MSGDEPSRGRPSTATDPRRLVESVDMRLLAKALFGDLPFGVLDDDVDLRWVCVRCGIRDANGGTAHYVDRWRWRCSHRACRHDGTRYELERAVLEDAVALGELYRLTEGGLR